MAKHSIADFHSFINHPKGNFGHNSGLSSFPEDHHLCSQADFLVAFGKAEAMINLLLDEAFLDGHSGDQKFYSSSFSDVIVEASRLCEKAHDQLRNSFNQLILSKPLNLS